MKSSIKHSSGKLLVMISSIILVITGCQKFNWFPPGGGHEVPPVKKINVSTAAQLYAAVNDATNTGALIILAPGTYLLDATQPNAGRIELLENMELQGQPGHAEKVIIDASVLPGTSFVPPLNFPAAKTGAIRMGRGFNSLEWVTVKGNATAQALSVIDADLIWTGSPSSIRIANCIVTGGRIGIDVRNAGVASAGRILEAALTANEITEDTVQQGQGIEIQNANGATGASILASLRDNYVHGNKVALRAFNNNANNTPTDSSSIVIQSTNDRFDENGIGLYLFAGLNQGTNTAANGNSLSFEAHGSSVQNNLGIIPPDVTDPAPCGLYVAAALSVNGADVSNNKLAINLYGTKISNNNGSDIKAYGALSFKSFPAGTGNTTEIHLDGISKQATIETTASLPAEPAGTNAIKVFK
ncbi:MAG TPA: hypothetical protein VIJ92_18175 [Ginsengibacter sp.]